MQQFFYDYINKGNIHIWSLESKAADWNLNHKICNVILDENEMNDEDDLDVTTEILSLKFIKKNNKNMKLLQAKTVIDHYTGEYVKQTTNNKH